MHAPRKLNCAEHIGLVTGRCLLLPNLLLRLLWFEGLTVVVAIHLAIHDNICQRPCRWWNWSSRSRLQPSRQTSTSAERHTPTDLSIRIKTLGAECMLWATMCEVQGAGSRTEVHTSSRCSNAGAEEKFMKKHVPAVYQTVRLLYLMIAVALPEALSRVRRRIHAISLFPQ